MNYPSATWVCTIEMEGGDNPAWRAVEDIIGETRDFPIVGPTPADGEPQQIPNPNAKYNVIGFAQFEIVDVNKASKLESGDVYLQRSTYSRKPHRSLGLCRGPDRTPRSWASARITRSPATGEARTLRSARRESSRGPGSLPNGNRSVKFSYATDDSDCGGNPRTERERTLSGPQVERSDHRRDPPRRRGQLRTRRRRALRPQVRFVPRPAELIPKGREEHDLRPGDMHIHSDTEDRIA